MKTSDLILIGAGGHCKSVIDVAESMGLNILGILDIKEKVGESILGHQVIGTDDLIATYVGKAEFVITIGFILDATIRIKLHEKIIKEGGALATLIASSAYVSKYASIGKGSVIMHNAIVNAGARVGDSCIINTFSNIEHDSVVGDFSHISTGAMVNGGCIIGKRSFLGSQSVANQGITIEADCIIASGSVIRKDLSVKGIYSGNPIKLIKRL